MIKHKKEFIGDNFKEVIDNALQYIKEQMIRWNPAGYGTTAELIGIYKGFEVNIERYECCD